MVIDELYNPNIRLFQQISNHLETEFKMDRNSSFHRATSSDKDKEYVMLSLEEHNIFDEDVRPRKHEGHLYATTPAQDLLAEGTVKLVSGGYKKSIDRMEDENANEPLANDRDIEQILNGLDEETYQAS